jgi:hypothetical protein
MALCNLQDSMLAPTGHIVERGAAYCICFTYRYLHCSESWTLSRACWLMHKPELMSTAIR